MQYKQNQKIIIDKRKLDILIRIGCPDELILQTIKTGTFTKTGDSLIDDTLECLIDVRDFENWGGTRKGAGRKRKNQDENHLENQVDNHLVNQDVNQDTFQLDDKDIDIDKDKNNSIKERGIRGKPLKEEEIIKEAPECMKEVIEKWIAYKKERKDKLTPTGLRDCIKKINKLSNGNPDVAMEIVEQSTSNGWMGLFPLKNNEIKKQSVFEKNMEKLKQMREIGVV